MSTPHQPPQKLPRRSARRQKQTQDYDIISSPGTASINDQPAKSQLYDAIEQLSPQKDRELKAKRKSQAPKKEAQGIQPDYIASQAQDIPQSHVSPPERIKATPMKQAYAGPTFHNSPAPSALPLPSFYSQSVPNVSTTKPSSLAKDSGAEPDHSLAESGNPVERELVRIKRDSTPLEFLFEAARQAKGNPRTESPSAHSIELSTYGHSPSSRSPAPREGDQVFPFELESNGTDQEDFGTPSSTPYKERIDALRRTGSAGSASTLDETERRAKTEALKKLLMNSQSPRETSGSLDPSYPNNPFHPPAPQLRTNYQPKPEPQFRHLSGPSTPVPFYGNQDQPALPQYDPALPPPNAQYFSPLAQRPRSSQLRNVYQPSTEPHPAELSSDNALSTALISTARKDDLRQRTRRQNADDMTRKQLPLIQTAKHRPAPSAQQLEDDLRRVLKLDLTSNG